MADIKSKKLLYAKGILFLLTGLAAALLIFIEQPTIKTTILLAICIWSFCRAYYFAFYVIEHYVDANFKFAGLIDFVRYLINKQENSSQHKAD